MTDRTALTADDQNLVWIDLEMTGLDPANATGSSRSPSS